MSDKRKSKSKGAKNPQQKANNQQVRGKQVSNPGPNPYYSKLAAMLVNPSDSEAVFSPTINPSRATIAKVRRTYSVSSQGPNTEFGGFVRPCVRDFFTMNEADVDQPVDGALLSIESDTNGMRTEVSDLRGGAISGATRIGTILSPGSTGLTWTTTSVSLAVQVYNPTGAAVVVEIHSEKPDGTGAEVNVSLGPYANGVATLIWSADSHLILASYALGGKAPLPVMATIDDPLATSIIMNSTSRPLYSDDWLGNVGEVQYYRVTALSVLISYVGNMLENAGTIAIARVPSDWIPPVAGSMFESVTRLNVDQHSGPLYKGAYGWRLPYEMGEMDFRDPLVSRFDSTAIAFGGTFGDGGGKLMIQVDAVVEYYSSLQIFTKAPLPPLTDSFILLWHQLSLVPAVHCNPSHLDLLNFAKKLARSSAIAVKGGIDWARANPETVKTVVGALESLAGLLL